MQIEVEGDWLYIHTGRDLMNIEVRKEEYDPFTCVQAIHIHSITGLKVDYQENSIRLFVKGYPYPIQLETGDRIIDQLNHLPVYLRKICDARGINYSKAIDTMCRTKETADARPRWKDMEEELEQYMAEQDMKPHEEQDTFALEEKMRTLIEEYKKVSNTIRIIHECRKRMEGIKQEMKVATPADP